MKNVHAKKTHTEYDRYDVDIKYLQHCQQQIQKKCGLKQLYDCVYYIDVFDKSQSTIDIYNFDRARNEHCFVPKITVKSKPKYIFVRTCHNLLNWRMAVCDDERIAN